MCCRTIRFKQFLFLSIGKDKRILTFLMEIIGKPNFWNLCGTGPRSLFPLEKLITSLLFKWKSEKNYDNDNFKFVSRMKPRYNDVP